MIYVRIISNDLPHLKGKVGKLTTVSGDPLDNFIEGVKFVFVATPGIEDTQVFTEDEVVSITKKEYFKGLLNG